MKYILLDNFNGSINVILDEIGEPLVFNNVIQAQQSLKEECQNGQIIPLGIDIIDLLHECRDIISKIYLVPMSVRLLEKVDEKLKKVLNLNITN